MAFYTQNQNQFAPVPMIGSPDMQAVVNSISAKITSSSVSYIQNGSVVKLVTGSAAEILVDAQLTNVDAPVFGVVAFSNRKNAYVPNDTVEVLLTDSIVYMLSGGAIARGDKVSATIAGAAVDCVVATDVTTLHYVVGIALDVATAAGQLVRVQIAPSKNP